MAAGAVVALQAWSRSGALAQVLDGLGRHGGKRIGVDVPGRGFGRALARGARGLGAAAAGGVLRAGERGLERVEVGELGDGVAAEAHQAVLVGFLRVFVDDAARVDGRHLGAVERGHLFEFAGVGVAAVLGETRGAISWVL